jgi:hypothetical protein
MGKLGKPGCLACAGRPAAIVGKSGNGSNMRKGVAFFKAFQDVAPFKKGRAKAFLHALVF